MSASLVRAAVERAFRDYDSDGVPASGAHNPVKSEIRYALGQLLETTLSAIGSGILRYANKAAMDAVTDKEDGQLAYVFDDATAANNTVYQWDDAGNAWVVAQWYLDALLATIQPLYDEIVDTADELADALAALQNTQTVTIGPDPLTNGAGAASPGITWRIKQVPFPNDAATFEEFGIYVDQTTTVKIKAIAPDNTVQEITKNLTAGEHIFPEADFPFPLPAGGKVAVYCADEAIDLTVGAIPTTYDYVAGDYAGGAASWLDLVGYGLQFYAKLRVRETVVTAASFLAVKQQADEATAVIAAGETITLRGEPAPTQDGAVAASANTTFIQLPPLERGGLRYIRSLPITSSGGKAGLVIYSAGETQAQRLTDVIELTLPVGDAVLRVGDGLPFVTVRDGALLAITTAVNAAATLYCKAPGRVGNGWSAGANVPDTVGITAFSTAVMLGWGFELAEMNLPPRRLESVPRLTSMSAIFTDGQSNSEGADAFEILAEDSTPWAWGYTWNVGLRMTKPGLGLNDNDGAIKLLVEGEDVPVGVPNYAQTHVSPMLKRLRRRLLNRGLRPGHFFASCIGYPGTTIDNIDADSTWYPNGTYHMEEAMAETEAIGFDFSIAFFTFDMTETDQANGQTLAWFYQKARNYFEARQLQAMAITGQDFRPHHLVTVAPYGIKISSGPSLALIQLARDSGTVHFVVPGYRVPYVNGTHLSNIGQALKGHYYARAADQVLAGHKPDCVEWLGATSTGTTLRVLARAPKPLGWDGGELSQAPDYGIVVRSAADVALVLSAMTWEVVGTCPYTGWPISMLKATTSAGAAGGKFRYALDTQGPSMWGAGGQFYEGASGNICDGTEETVTIESETFTLAHFAPPTEMSIINE